eukprot:144132-Rhodomonas_salina.2
MAFRYEDSAAGHVAIGRQRAAKESRERDQDANLERLELLVGEGAVDEDEEEEREGDEEGDGHLARGSRVQEHQHRRQQELLHHHKHLAAWTLTAFSLEAGSKQCRDTARKTYLEPPHFDLVCQKQESKTPAENDRRQRIDSSNTAQHREASYVTGWHFAPRSARRPAISGSGTRAFQTFRARAPSPSPTRPTFLSRQSLPRSQTRSASTRPRPRPPSPGCLPSPRPRRRPGGKRRMR